MQSAVILVTPADAAATKLRQAERALEHSNRLLERTRERYARLVTEAEAQVVASTVRLETARLLAEPAVVALEECSAAERTTVWIIRSARSRTSSRACPGASAT